MKKLMLPIVLILSVGSAHAMWWPFKKKATPLSTTRATISAPENVEANAPAETKEEQASEFALPSVEKFALGQGLLSRQNADALVKAITNGDVEKVKQILDEKTVDVTKPVKSIFSAGKSPLDFARESTAANKSEILKLLSDAAGIKEAEVIAEEAIAKPAEEKVVSVAVEAPVIEEKAAEEKVVASEAPAIQEETEFVALPVAEDQSPKEEDESEIIVLEAAPAVAESLAPSTAERILMWVPTAQERPTGEEVEGVSALFQEPVAKAARPLPPTPTTIVKQPMRVPSAPAPQLAVQPKASRPLPPTPVARIQEVKVEVTPKARRPLPPTPVAEPAVRPLPALPAQASRPLPPTPTAPVIFEELETEAFAPVAKPAYRPLPPTPVAKPAVRPLPALPVSK